MQKLDGPVAETFVTPHESLLHESNGKAIDNSDLLLKSSKHQVGIRSARSTIKTLNCCSYYGSFIYKNLNGLDKFTRSQYNPPPLCNICCESQSFCAFSCPSTSAVFSRLFEFSSADALQNLPKMYGNKHIQIDF